MFLLDSNAWITHLRSKGIGQLSARLLATPHSQILTCSVVRAELMTGALKSTKGLKAILEIESVLMPLRSFSFDDAAADEYAKIRSDLEKRGTKIGANDLLIAAIARVNQLTIVTHNTGEFSRVSGLALEDWQI